MTTPLVIGIQNADDAALRKFEGNRGCCAIILKVVTAVSNFFRTIGLWLVEASLWLKDRVIDHLPEQEAMRLDPRRKFGRAVLTIPANQRERVLRQALLYIAPQMDRNTTDTLIQLVNNENFVLRDILPFVNSDMYSTDSINTIMAIVEIPMERRADVIVCVAKLITEESRWVSGNLIKAINNIPSEEINEVTKNALALFTPQMNAFHKAGIIEVVTKIPANERADLICLVKKIIDAVTPSMNCYHITEIVRSLLKVSASERNTIESVLLLITPNMDHDDLIYMIDNICFYFNYKGGAPHYFIDLVVQIATIYPRINVFKAMWHLQYFEKSQVGQLALSLIEPTMNLADRVLMIKTVTEIPFRERYVVINLAKQVITPDAVAVFRKMIIDMIFKVESRDRDQFIQQARQLINDQMHARDIVQILRNLFGVPVWDRNAYVQRQLHNVVQNFQVAAEHGINVHEGNRDQRVRAAIELLRTHQEGISFESIDEAVQAFTQYLENRPMNVEHKRLAQYALSAPKGSDDFGPLLDENKFTIVGLTIIGKEVIGRLWIFASALTEPDQSNAKEGMIAALKDSCSMGARVCNGGKVQRLVVSVLQGRLAGVDIEKLSTIQSNTTEAITLFFQVPAHQHIEQLNALVEAANKFCDENPAVNRDPFLDEIRKYALAQDIT